MKFQQIALLVLLLLGSAAFAQSPVSVNVGEKKVVKVSMPIASGLKLRKTS